MDFTTAPLLVQAFYVFLANLLPLLLIAITIIASILGLIQVLPFIKDTTTSLLRRYLAHQQ